MMNYTSEHMKDHTFEIRDGGGGGGPPSTFLDPPLQVGEYKEITELDVYSLDI